MLHDSSLVMRVAARRDDSVGVAQHVRYFG
jgi:hypothetical protein